MRKNEIIKSKKKTKNGRKKKVGKKEKRAQRGATTPEMGPKIDFSHKNCQEKS